MATIGEVPLLLPSSPSSHTPQTIKPLETRSNTTSARNSAHGSDGIFDRHLLRSPIMGSESEYEDEDDLISEMPMDSNAPSCYGEETQEEHDFVPYTPSRGQLSPFRNPSSVRGMQLDTTPPHLRSSTRESSSKHHPRLSMASRNSTPRSVRSYRSGSPHKRITPVPKKDQPLVLLHVTILPISCPYSQAVLEAIAPSYILQNWKLLREKVPDTILERGILIPHPREEYELLEERLLESLELAVPRILKCGHYHHEGTEDEGSDAESRRSSHIHDSGNDSDDDSDICQDCTRRIRDGSQGSAGTGKRRWNIRIYAANGLMRAGAWSAAWKEMERVDVEISPWMDDSLRRALDLSRLQEEQDHARLVAEAQARRETPSRTSVGMDEERWREIYGDHGPPPPSIAQAERDFTGGDIVEAYKNSPEYPSDEHMNRAEAHISNLETPSPLARHAPAIRIQKRQTPTQIPRETPIAELLKNYIQLVLQDRRNVALIFLSVIVAWLALRPAPSISMVPAAAPTFEISNSAIPSQHENLISTMSKLLPQASSSTILNMSSSSLPTPPARIRADQEQQQDQEIASTDPGIGT